MVDDVERFSIYYFLLMVPSILFVLTFSYYLIKPYSTSTVYLAFFIIIVFAISIVRFDIQTMLTTLLLFGAIIIVTNLGISLNIKAINGMYVMSVVGAVIAFHTGLSEFPYLPKIGSFSAFRNGTVDPRISLFPYIPESSFFSIFIIVANYYLNPKRSRLLFYALGGYFLLFSGSRTALAIFAFFVAFQIITRYKQFKFRPFYLFLNVIFITAFIVMINLKSIHTYLSKIDNKLIKAIVLRDQQTAVSEASDIHDVATRTWIWSKHFEIFSQNPVFGVGTYNFSDFVGAKTKSYHFTTGSESFLTAWLARVGICVILIVFFVVSRQNIALRTGNQFLYYMCFFFFLVMISYGSFIVPYNFMFLLIVLSLSSITPMVNQK